MKKASVSSDDCEVSGSLQLPILSKPELSSIKVEQG